MVMSRRATQALDPAAVLSSAPWPHTCIVSWLGKGGPCLERKLHFRFTPPSLACTVPEWDSVMPPTPPSTAEYTFRPRPRLPAASEALPPPGAPPHSAPRQRARALPVDALRYPLRHGWVTSSRCGTGSPQAGSCSNRLEKLASALCSLPTAGVLVPSTAAPATSACAASTTTASGSTTAWARGTTGSFYTVWHLPYWASCSSCWWPLMSLWSSLSTPCGCVPTATLKNHTDVWFVFLPAAPVETRAPAILALAALLILLGLLSTALLGHLLCFHIYLMWHKLTTYEYIVQHRPPQEAKGAHRELESCPPKMRPIQEMEFYMRTFSHVHPEPPGQARPAAVNANPSQSLATRGQVEPPPHSSPETLALPPRMRPQKKRKRRMYKVQTSGTFDREPPLPRVPGPRIPGRRSSSSSDSADASPAGAYHSASAESMEEIPVAQTRLGSAALAAPVGRGREPGLELQARAPAVFVSPSSGEPGARGGPEAGLA
ncbi:palmitoyltransferase ZDHHC1 isoform X3 [Hippopotamus amphibius kiboko]|uniref:palmitoyltransferase ZDHHC1 isoform X3 n=1 Tax=Hippopotamus amphibius kiboko TaxID=575201 RepID=UPI0025940A8A|nr:palmitoyltransferase ZDHHC1 isoform X3 [Hippopotamus amphibius kiboko]